MIHDQLLRCLAERSGPTSTTELAQALALPSDAEGHAHVEIIAELSPMVHRQGAGWILSADTPARRVLAALRSYADGNPTKRIFRLSAALSDLPPQDQPTEDQLQDILGSSSEFKLLPNAMIKRVP